MLRLDKLKSVTKNRKRVGRGGSRGGQCGRGHKGQRSRSGGQVELKAFFEGGQMPLSRRLPRRGFSNPFKKDFKIVNLSTLELKFIQGDTVDRKSLTEKGLVKGKGKFLIKILGKGDLTKKLIVQADAFSKSAIEAIRKADGTIQLAKEVSSGSTS